MTVFGGPGINDRELIALHNLTNYERAGVVIDLIGKARFILEMNGVSSAEQVDIVIDALHACTALRVDPDDPTNSYREGSHEST